MRIVRRARRSAGENYLTAYIVRGNRQIREVKVKASKRFRIAGDTYIVKQECIFTRVNGKHLDSVSYYTEGNPYPHSFNGMNDGIPYAEFNVLYGEDLYDMCVKLQSDKKMTYLLLLYVFVMVTSIVTLMTGFISIGGG